MHMLSNKKLWPELIIQLMEFVSILEIHLQLLSTQIGLNNKIQDRLQTLNSNSVYNLLMIKFLNSCSIQPKLSPNLAMLLLEEEKVLVEEESDFSKQIPQTLLQILQLPLSGTHSMQVSYLIHLPQLIILIPKFKILLKHQPSLLLSLQELPCLLMLSSMQLLYSLLLLFLEFP